MTEAEVTEARKREARVIKARLQEVQELHEKGRRRCRSDLGVTTSPLSCRRRVKGSGRR